MQFSNYHSHCDYCDGRSMPEDFIKFAIRNHFRAYGFSSHAPLPFETFWNMSKSALNEYLEEISWLKAKYAGKLEVYTGLEVDYLDAKYNASINYFTRLPLDYRIGSIHYLPVAYPLAERNMMSIDGPFHIFAHGIEVYYEGDVRRLVNHYYDSSCAMVEAGGIDIVGHMDKIYMNGQKYPGFSLEEGWYIDRVLSYLDLIAEKGLIVEINTKNLRKNQEIYPHEKFLEAIRERHIPIMVNSDCHYPELVNDGLAEAFELLKSKGFKTTCELVNGKWEEIAIE